MYFTCATLVRHSIWRKYSLNVQTSLSTLFFIPLE